MEEKRTKEKHLKHPFYKDVEVYREKIRIGQIIKGSEKYKEPFTTKSWTNQEIVDHAMQENVDQAHYIYACLERLKTYEKECAELVRMIDGLKNDVEIWKAIALKKGND
jgi:N-formylglutamate amidohydrolase